MKPLIDLRNVSKTYWLGETEVKAVSGISLPIYRQEYLSILGASGSGKSTLMYLIGLLEIPSRGKISFNGRDVSKLADAKLSHLRNGSIGFVFQQFNLINKFTVLENVILPTRYSKTRLKFNPKNKARQLLKDFGILDRQDFFPNKISGGQQQRVAIARALIMNPAVLLADEPTGNLDSKTGPEILRLIESLRKKFKTTIIMVTHEKEVANRADKKIYIKDGRLVKKYL
ncbi:MAG: ABC transporter, ATP-binding protein [Candidatus Beckwithbacteria bacterium GW2011_GWB1_47_15]|uniref:ABC transporter, ATP-binding protein n=1 Tax=Candidatus Beckwithbacteria bacterium GW2011_GWB1_47_15 TaxID=1618371 RepID=A0A0G1RVJ8_9BACT|nr:MAG: ABC transporter, ATP-binding protein [Candidatus Beckwithbacteria bacterium GW2011_GWC1_49_16]KKU34942.1 MAG: ABC transporter, ATP-binding protein [Candidatus Beckwithbacteria bacterium GW2011_GWA1_46_30]KKU61349.1 MAG: ABC transporter, ATP-binding protein [Candidatus Beckwithbacteria bacterium GW2011_GWB1_47_15]KKU71380.1 MAG: ABC transporter, ATP-binding protein [Candidatus Beckwithbacteria bacterium GW2011_GWA2_47_25]OGD48704.1 MAG: ABC transporter ATP-binding protein [Candidatus Bec